jgi:predicted HD phosphohydrolase
VSRRLDSAEAIIDALAGSARDFDEGEPVDALDHALQTGALLVERFPEDLELQVAGLVHDIGSIINPPQPKTHARTGGAAVRDLLGRRVADLVAGHDHAKRYLVSTDPEYRGILSEISIATLTLQGGEMTASERGDFERGEHFEALVALRRADDGAKVPDCGVEGLERWLPRIQKVAERAK